MSTCHMTCTHVHICPGGLYPTFFCSCTVYYQTSYYGHVRTSHCGKVVRCTGCMTTMIAGAFGSHVLMIIAIYRKNCNVIWSVLYGKFLCPTTGPHFAPPFVGGSLLGLLSLLRWCFLYERYNFILKFNFMCLESLQVCICLIGVSITVECFFSIVSYVSQLRFWTVLQQYRVILFQLRSLFVLMLTASAVANAVSLFIQVRDHWIRHMVVTIQILQCVPSLLQVIHSLMQGRYQPRC